jgi:hypothetical protein
MLSPQLKCFAPPYPCERCKRYGLTCEVPASEWLHGPASDMSLTLPTAKQLAAPFNNAFRRVIAEAKVDRGAVVNYM